MHGETKDEAKRVTKDLGLWVSRMAERGIDTRQIQTFVKDYPLLTLAAIIATGYAVGRLVSKL